MRSFTAPLIRAPLILAPLLFSAALFCGAPAFAQGNPSSDDIINSLKPHGNLIGGGTRGIRLAAPSTEGTAPAQAPAESAAGAPAAGQSRVASARPTTHPGAAAAGSAPSVNLSVNFPNGSAELTPEAMATLDALGRALSSNELSSYRFRIEGHTDTVGSQEYNRALSQRRAEAVTNYIVTKYGVAASRLQAVGMGEQGLLVSTPEQTPEPRNRRVQVINIGT